MKSAAAELPAELMPGRWGDPAALEFFGEEGAEHGVDVGGVWAFGGEAVLEFECLVERRLAIAVQQCPQQAGDGAGHCGGFFLATARMPVRKPMASQ